LYLKYAYHTYIHTYHRYDVASNININKFQEHQDSRLSWEVRGEEELEGEEETEENFFNSALINRPDSWDVQACDGSKCKPLMRRNQLRKKVRKNTMRQGRLVIEENLKASF
jgi:hypothetical protein